VNRPTNTVSTVWEAVHSTGAGHLVTLAGSSVVTL
jgi:hypothetical protein